MAIAKKPNGHQLGITTEKAAEDFIAGAEHKSTKRERKTPVLIRFDPDTLKRIDQAAKRKGISRSAWVHFMVSRALEQEET
jgi:hypothetical protein